MRLLVSKKVNLNLNHNGRQRPVSSVGLTLLVNTN